MNIFGCFIYYYERNEYILFRYNSCQLILCNNVLKEMIFTNLYKMKKTEIYKGNMYGTLEYNLKLEKKKLFNNLLLKHKRNEDKYGKIVLSSGWKELHSHILLLKYIDKVFKININESDFSDKNTITFVARIVIKKRK